MQFSRKIADYSFFALQSISSDLVINFVLQDSSSLEIESEGSWVNLGGILQFWESQKSVDFGIHI